MTHSQIEEQFKGIEGINEAKKIYKDLAKRLHPDVGGTDEMFKLLNQVYNHILEHGLNFLNDSEFDVELEKVISKILHFENIVIEVIGSWIWLSGDTKEIKETLKELNFKWRSKKGMWSYGELKGKKNHKEQNIDSIKAKYGCQEVKTKQRNKLTA
jgi:hypothetical protein